MAIQILKRFRLLLPAAAIAAGLTACTTFDPARRDPQAEPLPKSYSRQADKTVKAPDRWWESFKAPQLNRLVGQTLTDNLDLQVAWARLRQANAVAAKAGAPRLPDAEAEAERSVATVIDAGKVESVNSFAFGLGISYEVDLWGRVRAGVNAARLGQQISRSDLGATALALSGSVADIWIQLLAANAEITLIKSQIATNEKRLGILRGRQRSGLSTALDVYQQQQNVAAAKLLLPPLQQQQELLSDQLALLRGRNPGTTAESFDSALPQLPAFPDLGVPADLLARRPDIQSAFLDLQAGDWDVTAAKADRLPALRLTGSLAAEAEHLDALFDDWLAHLAAGLTAPLLDGGRRKAEVARTKAAVDERLIKYRQTVLKAVHEVEAAIITEKRQLELRQQTKRQLDLANKTLAEADKRYRNALTDYITVLSSVTAVQRLERSLVQLDQRLLRNRITLYKALGGSWPAELEPPPQPETEQSNE